MPGTKKQERAFVGQRPAAIDRGRAREIIYAIYLAELVHRGQFDKGGKPYIFHALRVGIAMLPDVPSAVLGILHDTLEDGDGRRDAQIRRLSDEQGIGEDLSTLTRRGGETYESYIRRVAAGSERARTVKLADLRDNLRPDRLQQAAQRGVDVERLGARYTAAILTLTNSPLEETMWPEGL
jgi:(p)ppGpp synthase/HD superfamily hydrolase